jgi:hypothetical protein
MICSAGKTRLCCKIPRGKQWTAKGPLLLRFLDQQRLKATGPTNLTRLAHPMMLNDASGQVPRYKWLCDREAAIRTTFVAAVWRLIALRGSRSGLDAMLPLPFGAPMKFQWIDDDHRAMRFLQSLGLGLSFLSLLGVLGEREPPVGHVEEKRFMCRSGSFLRQSNALRSVVAQLIEAGHVRHHSGSLVLWLRRVWKLANDGTRTAAGACWLFAERGPIRDLLCLPTAPALPLWGTETSERRRFLAALGQAAACPYPGIWGVET